MADFTKVQMASILEQQATTIENQAVIIARLMAMFDEGEVKAKAQPATVETELDSNAIWELERVGEIEAELREAGLLDEEEEPEGHVYRHECCDCKVWYATGSPREKELAEAGKPSRIETHCEKTGHTYRERWSNR